MIFVETFVRMTRIICMYPYAPFCVHSAQKGVTLKGRLYSVYKCTKTCYTQVNMSQLLHVTHDCLRKLEFPACHETMSHLSATFRICFASVGKSTEKCTAQCNVYHFAYSECPEVRPNRWK